MDGEEAYALGFKITAALVFIGSYIYCIAAYGFLLGVGLGWLPSLIVAFVAGLLWPLILIIIALGVLVILFAVAN